MSINNKLFSAGVATLLASSALSYKSLDCYFESQNLQNQANKNIHLFEDEGFNSAKGDSLFIEAGYIFSDAELMDKTSKGYNHLGLLVLGLGASLLIGSYKPD